MKTNKFFLFLFFFLTFGCNPAKELSDLDEASDVVRAKKNLEARFCTPDEMSSSKLNYYIFIVDSSSSNIISDADKSKRITPIFNFLNSYPHDERDRFQLIIFQNSSSIASTSGENFNSLINHGTEATKFSKSLFLNQNEISNALSEFSITADAGNSNLESALDLAQDLIVHQQGFEDYRRYELDQNIPYSQIQYKIFLITDGMATNESGVLVTDSTDILSSATNLKSLDDKSDPEKIKTTVNNIQLNTGLYFNQVHIDCNTNPTEEYCKAKDLLQDVAVNGGGNFREFFTGNMIQFEKYLPITYRPIKNLIHFNVELAGLTWNKSSRKYERDSDTDGLSDEQEKILGSKLNKTDSDNDGLSDLVQLMITGEVCQDTGCPSVHTVYPGCFKINEEFFDTDGDGLNDCEEIFLGSNPNSSDSNKNYLTDAQEIVIGLNPSVPFTLWGDGDLDGFSLEKELKKFSPDFIKNNNLADQLPNPIYELIIDENLSLEEGRKCYNLKAKDLPITTDLNELRLNLVFQDRIQSADFTHQFAKRIFRYGEKMKFEPDEFQSTLAR